VTSVMGSRDPSTFQSPLYLTSNITVVLLFVRPEHVRDLDT
jgi:hypothetical protein